jgi:hypothetical protein
MDRAQILTYLQAAEQHVADGERQIANRRDFVLSLKCAGADCNRETAELLEMEKAQMQYIAERDRLRTELAVLNALAVAKSASYVTSRDPRAVT